MNKFLFSPIVAGFFVSLFLLGIIICVVYILYVLAAPQKQKGKPYMGLFTIRYYREIHDGGELKKRVRVYRVSSNSPKSNKIKRKKTPKKRPSGSSSVSQRIYYVNGVPTLDKPAADTRSSVGNGARLKVRL